MRMIDSFGVTLRETPSDAQTIHHQLLVRAAYASPHQPGRFTLLPLGDKFKNRLIAQVVAAYADLAPQAIQAPLGLTTPDFLADVLARQVRSQKHLPRCLFLTHHGMRSKTKAALGFFSASDTNFVQLITLAGDEQAAAYQYDQLNTCLRTLLERCRIPFVEGEGRIPDTWKEDKTIDAWHSYAYVCDAGEEIYYSCPHCGYRAHEDVAGFRKERPAGVAAHSLEKVATPDCKTIAALARYLDIPETSTAKAVFLIASLPVRADEGSQTAEHFVFAILRGDMELNESKLASALGAVALRPASGAEIHAAGAVPGYASPVGLQPRVVDSPPVITIVDDLIPSSPNLVGGANIEGYHFINVNYGRDFTAQIVADIVACQAGFPCLHCGTPLQSHNYVDIAHIGRLGTRFSLERHCLFHNEEGQVVPMEIGVAEIDVGCLMACIVEANHDEAGMILPPAVAPYDIHLIYLPDKKDVRPLEEAERLYHALQDEGWRVFYDERDERPGVKFNDADLIGLPVRLTVSTRSLESGGVECKMRSEADKQIIALPDIIPHLKTRLSR